MHWTAIGSPTGWPSIGSLRSLGLRSYTWSISLSQRLFACFERFLLTCGVVLRFSASMMRYSARIRETWLPWPLAPLSRRGCRAVQSYSESVLGLAVLFCRRFSSIACDSCFIVVGFWRGDWYS